MVVNNSMIAEGKTNCNTKRYYGEYSAIVAIVDGGWCECTHKHSYNALTAKKSLYVGV